MGQQKSLLTSASHPPMISPWSTGTALTKKYTIRILENNLVQWSLFRTLKEKIFGYNSVIKRTKGYTKIKRENKGFEEKGCIPFQFTLFFLLNSPLTDVWYTWQNMCFTKTTLFCWLFHRFYLWVKFRFSVILRRTKGKILPIILINQVKVLIQFFLRCFRETAGGKCPFAMSALVQNEQYWSSHTFIFLISCCCRSHPQN